MKHNLHWKRKKKELQAQKWNTCVTLYTHSPREYISCVMVTSQAAGERPARQTTCRPQHIPFYLLAYLFIARKSRHHCCHRPKARAPLPSSRAERELFNGSLVSRFFRRQLVRPQSRQTSLDNFLRPSRWECWWATKHAECFTINYSWPQSPASLVWRWKRFNTHRPLPCFLCRHHPRASPPSL